MVYVKSVWWRCLVHTYKQISLVQILQPFITGNICNFQSIMYQKLNNTRYAKMKKNNTKFRIMEDVIPTILHNWSTEHGNKRNVLWCFLVVCLNSKSLNLWPQIIYLMTMYYKPSAKSMIMYFLCKNYGLRVVTTI